MKKLPLALSGFVLALTASLSMATTSAALCNSGSDLNVYNWSSSKQTLAGNGFTQSIPGNGAKTAIPCANIVNATPLTFGNIAVVLSSSTLPHPSISFIDKPNKKKKLSVYKQCKDAATGASQCQCNSDQTACVAFGGY